MIYCHNLLEGLHAGVSSLVAQMLSIIPLPLFLGRHLYIVNCPASLLISLCEFSTWHLALLIVAGSYIRGGGQNQHPSILPLLLGAHPCPQEVGFGQLPFDCGHFCRDLSLRLGQHPSLLLGGRVVQGDLCHQCWSWSWSWSWSWKCELASTALVYSLSLTKPT